MKRVSGNAMNMVGGKTNKLRKALSSKKPSKISVNKNKIITSVVVILVLITTIILVLLFSDYFMLKRVKIHGMIRSNSFDILSMAGIEQNKNIFLISRDNIKDNIEQDKLLIVRSISLEPPDMITIVIEEREAVALIEYNRAIYEITADNYIIKRDSVYNYNLPYLKGFELDPQAESVDNDYTLYMVALLTKFYENNIDIFNSISEIDASDQDVVLYTRGYNTKVLMPRYITEKKLIDLAAILTLLKANNEKVIQIDFRFENAILKYE